MTGTPGTPGTPSTPATHSTHSARPHGANGPRSVRSPLDPRTPVIVGVSGFSVRSADPYATAEPLDLMTEAALRAVADAGGRVDPGQVDMVAVLRGFWPYRAPATRLARRLGATCARTMLAPPSGNHAQLLFNRVSKAIQDGDVQLALVTGAETSYSQRRIRALGGTPAFSPDAGVDPDPLVEEGERIRGAAETGAGIRLPAPLYALIDSALRHRNGWSVAEHRQRIGRLYADFAAVAAAEPEAWDRAAHAAEALLAEGRGNRLVAAPYTTRLVSDWNVDQAAAVVVCSADMARRAGVPYDRWVFPHSGADSTAVLPVSERVEIHRRPQVATVGRCALALAETDVADLAHVDLYSCFPAAVQVQAEALGLALDPVPTVTGGMAFAGGPVNSYALHSTAVMVRTLRGEPGGLGLVSSVGGVLDKQSFGVLSTAPPPGGRFRYADLTGPCGREEPRESAADRAGVGRILGSTVLGGRDGRREACLLVELSDGARTIASTTDEAVGHEVLHDETVGRKAVVDGPVVVELC